MIAASPVAPAQVERALERVYAGPEFQPAEPSSFARWIGGVWSAIKAFLGRLIPDLPRGDLAGSIVFWILVGVVAVVALLMILHFAGVTSTLWRSRERRRMGARTQLAARPVRSDDWEARAHASAQAGQWREAALAQYQALLRRLEARGVLRYDPSRTPGEYRRDLRKQSELGAAFEAYLRLFEPVAFGNHAVDAARYTLLNQAAGRVVSDG